MIVFRVSFLKNINYFGVNMKNSKKQRDDFRKCQWGNEVWQTKMIHYTVKNIGIVKH